MRVSGEDDTVGETRESRSKRVGELAARAMADMEDFLGRGRDIRFRYLARANGSSESGKDSKLHCALNLSVRIC